MGRGLWILVDSVVSGFLKPGDVGTGAHPFQSKPMALFHV